MDYDIIGSMLLALRAFVRDSFAGDFEEVGFGERRVLLIQGEHVLGALLLRGESSEKFRRAARAAILKAEEALRAEVVNWKGTGMIAERMLPYLESLVRGARLGSGTAPTV